MGGSVQTVAVGGKEATAVAVMASVAEFESRRISRRTRDLLDAKAIKETYITTSNDSWVFHLVDDDTR